MTHLPDTLLTRSPEGFCELVGAEFYVIPDLESLAPFLLSLVSPGDHWCFISSAGALTAGRRNAETALFPYETDDRLHLATGISGPATVIRVGSETWEPFGRRMAPGAKRAIAKSTLGDAVIFEEVNEDLGLAIQFRWTTSDRFGFVRRVELANIGSSARDVLVGDGIVNVLPAGLVPDQYHSMSNLTNAYRRSELVGGPGNLALHTLEALIVDQAIPAESLRATVTWSFGPGAPAVTVDGSALAALRTGTAPEAVPLMTGRTGAHVVMSEVALAPGESSSWYVVADVAQDHAAVVRLQSFLAASDDVAKHVEASVRHDSDALVAKLAGADAFQKSGDARASAHHAGNVLFNVMRGGVFSDGYRCSMGDFARFVAERNRRVATRHAAMLADLAAHLDRGELIARAAATGDPDLERLALEYLPLTFSRRHGDPSRPWNRFSIHVREADGTPILWHEGNWRDIFQNWEALCLSYPEFLPGIVAVFVNASTPDGFNPYRITRRGIDWEEPDPEDPWSNIGYWGDHQIIYLLRLLEAAGRLVPGAIDDLLHRRLFTYADVPYRLKGFDDLVADPRETIDYDDEAASRALERTAGIGGDGRLLTEPGGDLHRVTLFEKLLVPALSKLSNYVPGGGIWMNTQRPEWNDANNALVGNGLSMVTLYHLRRYLAWLADLAARRGDETMTLSAEVAEWLDAIARTLRAHGALTDAAVDDDTRAEVIGALGRAFAAYREQVYSAGFSGVAEIPVARVRELCEHALPHLDATIRENRRDDGLYHAYNLIRFGAGGESAEIERLPEMLEGQAAVLSCGLLAPSEAADVIDALYSSALYRPDQDSFILYPNRRLPSFLAKNVIPEDLVVSNPLLTRLLEAGERSVVITDVDGAHHFSAELRNATALQQALDRLASDPEWRTLVEEHRGALLDAYESVFHHHAFTGRSGTMYAYEGLGSIYWHMVGKLLVAAQECVVDARRSGAEPAVVARLRQGYHRIRAGLGFNKTAAEYGAFPTDPYSHTPSHAGAQQPGMTGQVKEEILTRIGELGVWFENGELLVDPVLLRSGEFLTEPATWTFIGVDGRQETMALERGSFGLTVCQVPVVVAIGGDTAYVEVTRTDGSVVRVEGSGLDRDMSREIFGRTGMVTSVSVRIPGSALAVEAP